MSGRQAQYSAARLPRYLAVVAAGPRFHALLSCRRRYRVHSVFKRALNLWDGREFLTVLPISRGGGETYATLALAPGESFLDLGATPGLEADVCDGALVRIGSEIVFDFGHAWTWRSRLAQVASADAKLDGKRLEAFRRVLVCAPVGSLFLGALMGSSVPAAALLDDLRESVIHADMARLDTTLGSLVGLGPGLTPSGDDVLAGMSLARATFRRARGVAGQADVLWEAGVRSKLGSTHELSAFFIEEALAGRSHEFVEDALGALFEGDPQETAIAARKLIGMGATSGVDTGVGVYLAVEWERRYAWCSGG